VVGTDSGEVILHKPVVYQPATYNEPRTKNQELVEGQIGNQRQPAADGSRTEWLVVQQAAASVEIPLSGTGTP